MRRGGRLFLLLGIVVAAVAALVLFVFLQPQQSPGTEVLTPTVELKKKIVVAHIDIPNNTVLSDTETFLQLTEIPESEFNAAQNQYFTSISDLQDKVTLRAISATEPVRRSDVGDAGLSLRIPPAQPNQPRPKAITFQVNSLSGVADQIKQNDYVDVLASFLVQRTVLRPGFDEKNQIIIKEEPFEGQTTKTLLQNVQVLDIRRPPPPPSGTTTPGAAPAAQPSGPPEANQSGQPAGTSDQGQPGEPPAGTNEANTFREGNWLLILAVTDQQAEILKFAIERGTGITLVLRGRGDTANETTLGATLDLLVSNFGLPLPNPAAPAVGGQEELTPLPTTNTTPAATTPVTGATVTPTPTP